LENGVDKKHEKKKKNGWNEKREQVLNEGTTRPIAEDKRSRFHLYFSAYGLGYGDGDKGGEVGRGNKTTSSVQWLVECGAG